MPCFWLGVYNTPSFNFHWSLVKCDLVLYMYKQIERYPLFCRFPLFVNMIFVSLEIRDLFHPLPSGFRRKHSYNTALARLTESWLSAINGSDLFGDVFLDI